MQFSENWLRQLVDPQLDSAALSELLTMAGLEVEEAAPVAPPFSGVVVAQVVECEPHPNADRLKVCQVEAGNGERLQVVCGAPNVVAGMKAPLAVVGAELGDFKIKQAKLRGVASSGMLCSARELGLSDDHSGLLRLPDDAPVGQNIREFLALDDIQYTIKLTPNRSDCLSLTGIAREVAALTGAPLNLPAIEKVAATIDAQRGIVLEAPQVCPRYCGRLVQNVDANAATPAWMKRRLERCGVRSISALVDITNYVMLELGQPLHVFDDDKLSGNIRVRYPVGGESIELLNGQIIEPQADTLLITDDNHIVALAGVMGGEESGVTLQTRNIFLESAFFAPEAVAGRARVYGFTSDASHRYERGVDFELGPVAIERATALILSICGGEAGPVVEAIDKAHLPQRPPVRLRPQRVRRVLGIALDDAQMRDLLLREHLTVTEDNGTLVVVPPSYRFDLEREEDLIEEIVRLYGYDNVPVRIPQGSLDMLELSEQRRPVWRVRDALVDRDYQEVINYAFVDAEWERDFCANDNAIALANPIASQMSVMRSGLIAGLVSTLITNRSRQQSRVRLFEIGSCFAYTDQEDIVPGFHQPIRLAALAFGPALPEQWGAPRRQVDFYDVKGDLEALFAPRRLQFSARSHPALHPGRAAAVTLDGEEIGCIGELHPVWVQKYDLVAAPIVFEIEMAALLRGDLPQYREISRQPAVLRDLALIVNDDLEVASVQQTLDAAAAPIVRSIELFDVYQGKGIEPNKKSLAFRVLMQDTQRTLEDGEVDEAIDAMVCHAETSLGAQLRGN